MIARGLGCVAVRGDGRQDISLNARSLADVTQILWTKTLVCVQGIGSSGAFTANASDPLFGLKLVRERLPNIFNEALLAGAKILKIRSGS